MPNLQNVEKIVQQEAHRKSWFNRFKTKALVASSALVIGSTAIAAEGDPAVPDFLSGAKAALAGIGLSLGELFMVVIGIILVIIAFSNSKGGLKRAG
jgi:hypothetical protein